MEEQREDAFERAWSARVPAAHEVRAAAAVTMLLAALLVDVVVLQRALLRALALRAPAWLQCLAVALMLTPVAMAVRSARRVRADKARARVAAGPRVQYLYVEGNMGAGKSTLLRRCAAPLRALLAARGIALEVVPEPVNRWTHVGGGALRAPATDAAAALVTVAPQHNLLSAYYADQVRWGLAFQTHALVTRIEALDRAVERATARAPGARVVVLAERSIHIDRHVFVHALCATQRMTPLEAAVYADAYTFWAKRLLPGHTAAVVYLRLEPDQCEANVRYRGREEERGVALDYLRALHERHDELLAAAGDGGGSDWWNAERLVLDEAALRGLPADDAVATRLAAEMAAFIV